MLPTVEEAKMELEKRHCYVRRRGNPDRANKLYGGVL